MLLKLIYEEQKVILGPLLDMRIEELTHDDLLDAGGVLSLGCDSMLMEALRH